MEMYHITSLDAAESILRHKAISGTYWENRACHEGHPHFNVPCYPPANNALACETPSVALYFETDLPPMTTLDYTPIPDVVTMYYTYREFWQATVYPGNDIIFTHAEFSAKPSLTLRCLVEDRRGAKIRAVWNPQMRRGNLPAEQFYTPRPWGTLERLWFLARVMNRHNIRPWA